MEKRKGIVMKITVTDLDTNETTSYDLSRQNWRNAWACMRDGLVHMWAPPQLPITGQAIVTSGRRWQVVT
jgi:hypothetical protein